MLLCVCRPKRGTRLSLGSGGGGSVGGSDSIDDLGMDPADFPGAAAQGASTAKRIAFLEGMRFEPGSNMVRTRTYRYPRQCQIRRIRGYTGHSRNYVQRIPASQGDPLQGLKRREQTALKGENPTP